MTNSLQLNRRQFFARLGAGSATLAAFPCAAGSLVPGAHAPGPLEPEPHALALVNTNQPNPMPTGVKSHMNRDVGLAWLDLSLVAPANE